MVDIRLCGTLCKVKARIRKKSDPDLVYSPPGQFHADVGGKCMVSLSDFFAPEPREIQRMLRVLRQYHRWSQPFAAAVFGVSASTLSKWEIGARHPNGAAAKLVFLLYDVLLKQRKIRNVWDLALWGHCPSPDIDEIIRDLSELSGTHFVPLSKALSDSPD
jgi:DNA-binding transcriptional regulator YiaG